MAANLYTKPVGSRVGGNDVLTIDQLCHQDYWVQDTERYHCHICARNFTRFRRKHHCRKCGEVVCSNCLRKKQAELPVIGLRWIKVCASCVMSLANSSANPQAMSGVAMLTLSGRVEDCVGVGDTNVMEKKAQADAGKPKSMVARTTAVSTGRANSNTMTKYEGYLSWDDYFMSVAFLSAMRSKDPSTQAGACIVNDEKRIVGIGYNVVPQGCSADVLPWASEAPSRDPPDTKYLNVCHAEMNAILNESTSDIRGCTLYVALFPCDECAKLIIQSGIKRVVYLSDSWKTIESRRLLDMANVHSKNYV